MARLHILFPLFVAVALSFRLALLISPSIIFRRSHPLVESACEHLYDIVASIQRTTFTVPCMFPLVSWHVSACHYPGLSTHSEDSCQVLNDILYDAHVLSDRLVYHAAPSRDFTTAVYSVVNEFDRFLSLRDGHIVPEEHRSLVDVAHDIIALLAANSKAIARVVAHVELIVSGMAARELAISDVLCLPRWFFTDDLGVASVALHNTLHTFVSSANASASYLDHSLSAAQDSTKRVLDRLEDLNALGRGQIAPWKCPWPVISSAVDDPTSELPLPCATSFVARHCIIRMQAVHGILSTIREDVADIISDLGSRSIPPPPFDRCPLDVAYVKYHGHAQLLQKRSLALADFRSRVFAQLNAG